MVGVLNIRSRVKNNPEQLQTARVLGLGRYRSHLSYTKGKEEPSREKCPAL